MGQAGGSYPPATRYRYCPYRDMARARSVTPSWWGASAPVTQVVLSATTWIGVVLQFTTTGWVYGARLYTPGGQPMSAEARFYNRDALARLASKQFATVTPVAAGWLQCWFRPRIAVVTGINYVISVMTEHSYYRTNTALVVPVTHSSIEFFSSFQTTAIDPMLANPTGNTNANGVDVLFSTNRGG